MELNDRWHRKLWNLKHYTSANLIVGNFRRMNVYLSMIVPSWLGNPSVPGSVPLISWDHESTTEVRTPGPPIWNQTTSWGNLIGARTWYSIHLLFGGSGCSQPKVQRTHVHSIAVDRVYYRDFRRWLERQVKQGADRVTTSWFIFCKDRIKSFNIEWLDWLGSKVQSVLEQRSKAATPELLQTTHFQRSHFWECFDNIYDLLAIHLQLGFSHNVQFFWPYSIWYTGQ